MGEPLLQFTASGNLAEYIKRLYRLIVPKGVRRKLYGWRHAEHRLEMRLHRICRPAIEAFVQALASDGLLHGRVLEIGAGEGTLNKLLFSRTAGSYWRSDILFRSHPESKPDIVCDCTCLPFATGSLDGVVCSEVLEHIPKMHDAIREVGRTLRRGGSLVLTIPFFYPLHGVDKQDQGDYWRLSPGNLKRLLGSDFELVRENRSHLFSPSDNFVVNIQMLWRRKK